VIRFSHQSIREPWDELFESIPSAKDLAQRCHNRAPGTRVFLKLLMPDGTKQYQDLSTLTKLFPLGLQSVWNSAYRIKDGQSALYPQAKAVLRGQCGINTPPTTPPRDPLPPVPVIDHFAAIDDSYEGVQPNHALTLERFVTSSMSHRIPNFFFHLL
jgi:hypothetical protein